MVEQRLQYSEYTYISLTGRAVVTNSVFCCTHPNYGVVWLSVK